MINQTAEGYTVGMADQDENEYLYMAFGDAVRYLLGQRGLSQAQLAERLGVSQATISLWVDRPTAIADTFKLWELARVLGTTADDLRAGRVRVEPEPGRTMDDYIRRMVDEAPEGVDRDRLRELLEIAASLPPDALDALVDFGEYQRTRGGITPGRKRRRKASGGEGDNPGDSSGANVGGQ